MVTICRKYRIIIVYISQYSYIKEFMRYIKEIKF